MQANQVSEKTPKRSIPGFSRPGPVDDLGGRRCPYCSAAIQNQANFCPSCGQPLKSGNAELISLRDTGLFGAILSLVALAIAPVWPKEQVYGRSIQFLMNVGAAIPGSPDEAISFRHQMMNVVQLYQGFNLLHYLLISTFIIVFGMHLFRKRKKAPGFKNTVWLILGALLLVFPAVNLALSWNMFLSPGVLGTAFASVLVLVSARFLE